MMKAKLWCASLFCLLFVMAVPAALAQDAPAGNGVDPALDEAAAAAKTTVYTNCQSKLGGFFHDSRFGTNPSFFNWSPAPCGKGVTFSYCPHGTQTWTVQSASGGTATIEVKGTNGGPQANRFIFLTVNGKTVCKMAFPTDRGRLHGGTNQWFSAAAIEGESCQAQLQPGSNIVQIQGDGTEFGIHTAELDVTQ